MEDQVLSEARILSEIVLVQIFVYLQLQGARTSQAKLEATLRDHPLSPLGGWGDT